MRLGRGRRRRPAELPVSNPISKAVREKFAPPKVADTDLAVVLTVIEAEENGDVRLRLNRFISNIQVLTSRLGLITNTRSGLSAMAADVDAYLTDAAILHAQASSCFDYTRRTTPALRHQASRATLRQLAGN